MMGNVSGLGRKIAIGLGTAVLMTSATALLSPASATLFLELQSGASDVLITDGGVGDTDATPGSISTNANVVPTWSGLVGASEDLSSYELDSSASTLKTSVPGSTITIATTETFTVYGHTFEVQFGFGGSNSGSSSAMSDALYLNGVLTDTLNGSGNFSKSYVSGDLAPGVYTIEELVTLTQSGTNSQTFSSSADLLIPEPLTLSVFGAGLFGIGLLKRRKRD